MRPPWVYLRDLVIEAATNAQPLTVVGSNDGSVPAKVYTKNTTAHSLLVRLGGFVYIEGRSTVKFTKTVPGTANLGVWVYGGLLAIENGSTLDVGTNKIAIQGGTTELNPFAGNLSTYAVGEAGSPGQAEPEAVIKTTELQIGGGEGFANVRISDNELRSDLAETDHRFAILKVIGNVTWESGTYWATVDATDMSKRDRWICDGTFKINGTKAEVSPIGSPAVGKQYAVLESTVGFAPTVAGNAVLPTIEGTNQDSQNLWKWKQGTAYGKMVWYIERERA